VFLNVLIVRFQENQQHKVDEVIGDQVGVTDIVNDAVENDVSQLQHAVSQKFNE
jgi:hypothetical protein